MSYIAAIPTNRSDPFLTNWSKPSFNPLVLKLMNFVSKMMDFSSKTVDFVFKMMIFIQIGQRLSGRPERCLADQAR